MTHTPMHILISPSEHFVTPAQPLGGVFQLHQANALHDAGHQVGVIGSGVITTRFLFKRYPYPRYDIAHGYPVYRDYRRTLYPQRILAPERSASRDQRWGLRLYEKYRRKFGPPDVVHAHNVSNAGFIAQAIREAHGVPYVITEHNGQFMTAGMAPRRLDMIRRSIQGLPTMTAVSQALADAIRQKTGVGDIDVLPNVVDSAFLQSPLRSLGSESEIVFLTAGSLDANKNQALLIEAFAARFKGKRCSLRIAGSGPSAPDLRRLAERLGVRDQVVFLGALNRPSMLREMQTARCFVLPSHRETFGVVLIEALASGTPIIATRCGGPQGIVTDENGLLVEPGDGPGLADAMEAMAQATDRYEPIRLREACRDRFGEDAFVRNALRLYQHATTTRGASAT